MDIKNEILRYNTRDGVAPELSPWFSSILDEQIRLGIYSGRISEIRDGLVKELEQYRTDYGVSNIVLGMSGGIDSALTAALFKEAGWEVTGMTLPIHQNQEETDRGVEACEALGINHIQVDLSEAYDAYRILALKEADPDISVDVDQEDKSAKVRAGNIRARLRMITLYNMANKLGGIVGSTDNFSELSAGFWTLHGDVGDVAPIQSLTKSWEVPLLAEALGVPSSIVEATPTDGLGVDAGDEAQFGFSYLHFDIVLLTLLSPSASVDNGFAGASEDDLKIIEAVKSKIRSTGYKRINPVNLDHPIKGNALYDALQNLDDKLLREE